MRTASILSCVVDVGVNVDVGVAGADVSGSSSVDVDGVEKNSIPAGEVLVVGAVVEESVRASINNTAAAKTVVKATAAATTEIHNRFKNRMSHYLHNLHKKTNDKTPHWKADHHIVCKMSKSSFTACSRANVEGRL